MSVCKGNFPVYEHKEALWLVLLLFLGLPAPPTSALRLPSPHHLWSVSPSQEENADGFLQPAHRPSVSGVCVCASACTLGGNQSKKEGKTEIINSATCFARGADKGDILHMNAAPFYPSLQAFDLDIASSPEPPRVCFSLSLCSLHFLVLSSSLQLSGWRACSLGVFRLWRDPNFLF